MDAVTLNVKAVFPHKHLAKGRHTFLLPLDPEIEGLIGKIVSTWGAYELRMDSMIWEFSKVMQLGLEREWERQEFRRRKEKFKALAIEYTRQMFPQWEKRIGQLADTSGDLHWRRNLVAHGYYEIEPLQGSDTKGEYRFLATGTVKGKKRSLYVDSPTLTKLWHDIAHLLGELMVFINHTGAKSSGFEFVVPDDDFLKQDAGDFRLLAVSDKLPPAPLPSGK